MAFQKKNWLARIGVGLNRFLLNGNQNVTLQSNPVSVSQAGDALSADNMNNLETRIENGFNEMAGNLAPVEVSPSQHNYAKGALLVYNGILCEATSAIATGNSLVIGSNLQAKPVSSSLSDLIDTSGVAEQGAGYIRYNNGIQICWAVHMLIGGNGTVGWGTMYVWIANSEFAFPKPFNARPSITVTCSDNASGVIVNTVCNSTKITQIAVMRQSAQSQNFINVNYIAIGTWK